MQENTSYVFFRELDAEQGRDGPLGAEGVVLTPGRSLAVDTEYTALGTPVFVAAPDLETPEGRAFRRLMIGQDVGSAIRGPERGDIFWGTGRAAGAIAGRTRHAARLHRVAAEAFKTFRARIGPWASATATSRIRTSRRMPRCGRGSTQTATPLKKKNRVTQVATPRKPAPVP